MRFLKNFASGSLGYLTKAHFFSHQIFFLVAFLSAFFWVPQAFALDYGLRFGYTASLGILQSRAQTGSVKATLNRPLGGTVQVFLSPADSRWAYALEETLSPNLTLGSVDFQCLGLGFDLAYYEPTRVLAGGAVEVQSTRIFEPYLKGRLVIVEHTTAYLNPTNESIDAIKIQNIGVLSGGGLRYKSGYVEAGLLLAPVSLTNPAFFQLWALFTLGWSIKVTK